MKDKYIERRFPRYIIFGEHKNGYHVDIASAHDDNVATVSREGAIKLIENRNELLNAFCELIQEFDKVNPDAFSNYWYGPSPKKEN